MPSRAEEEREAAWHLLEGLFERLYFLMVIRWFEYHYVITSNIYNFDVDVFFLGFGTMTGATGHVVPFRLHPVS
jgi:hypothetical protein